MSDCEATCRTTYLAEITAAMTAYSIDLANCGSNLDCQITVAVALTDRLTAARLAYDACMIACGGGEEG